MASDERSARTFETLIEEYKLQRAAVGDKFKASQQTLTFGGAITGILVAAGFNIWEQTLPSTLIFLIAVPLVSAATVIQWVGQMRSFSETHRYITALEEAIFADLRTEGDVPRALFAKQTPKSPVWYYLDERWFQSAAIVVFGLLALGSLALGIYQGSPDHKVFVVGVATGELIVLLITAILLLWSLRVRPAKERNAR